MVYSVGFHRLDFIRLGKDKSGKRIYKLYHYRRTASMSVALGLVRFW